MTCSYTEAHLDPYKTILNMQGLPRDLSLSSETELLQQFVPELKRLRLGPPITIHSVAAAAAVEPLTRLPPGSYSTGSNGSGGGGDSSRALVAAVDSMGPRVEITCTFTIAAGHLPGRPFGISVLRRPGGSERTDLAVDMARGYVMIDGTKQHTAVRAGPILLPPPPPPAPAAYTATAATAAAVAAAGGRTGSNRADQNGATSAMDKNGSTTTTITTVWMHAIIDACVIEVIWNNRTALTTQVHPSAETSTGIALFGVGQGAVAEGGGGGVTAQCTAWRLAPANNTS